MWQLKCRGSPRKKNGFNSYWSQTTQPCKSRNSGSSRGAGALPSTVNNNSNTPGATSCFTSDSLWHFPSEREKAAEKPRGILLSLCPTAPFRNGDTRKKIQDVAFQIWEERASSKLQLLLRGFSLFFFLLCTGPGPAAGFCFLVKKQDLPLSKARGQNSGSLFLSGLSPENTPVLQPVWGSTKNQLCSGIFCGTTTEINSCNDTL